MRRKTMTILGAIVLVLAAAATSFALVLTAANDEPQDPSTTAAAPSEEPTDEAAPDDSQPPASQAPDPAGADREAMEALAIEAAEIMTTWDSIEDLNATEAEERAADLMTKDRADRITVPERPNTSAEWNAAAEQKATSEPHVQINTGTENDVVSVQAEWVWTTDEGHVVAHGEDRRIYYFEFTEEGGELQISDYTWETS